MESVCFAGSTAIVVRTWCFPWLNMQLLRHYSKPHYFYLLVLKNLKKKKITPSLLLLIITAISYYACLL